MIISQGNDRVIVPRNVYSASQMVAKDPIFVRSVDRMLNGVISDDLVTGFGITPDLDKPPALILSRE